jgi:hypothetical protein
MKRVIIGGILCLVAGGFLCYANYLPVSIPQTDPQGMAYQQLVEHKRIYLPAGIVMFVGWGLLMWARFGED